jgi:preprotein translocase subunit SecG
MLQTIVLIAHVLVAFLLIGLVLLQRGKGAEAGTGFGAGASGTVFGSRGSANFLSRTTGALATLFFITSLSLAYFSTQRPAAPDSLLERSLNQQSAPQQPAATPPAAGDERPPGGDDELPQRPGQPPADAGDAGGAGSSN